MAESSSAEVKRSKVFNKYIYVLSKTMLNASVAELVDAVDSKSTGVHHLGSSSLPGGTKLDL